MQKGGNRFVSEKGVLKSENLQDAFCDIEAIAAGD